MLKEKAFFFQMTETIKYGTGMKGAKLVKTPTGKEWRKQIEFNEAAWHKFAEINSLGPKIHYESGVLKTPACGRDLTEIDQMSKNQKQKCLIQLSEIEEKMKKLKIAHCDVKPKNVIVDNAGNIKLIDWDEAKNFGEIRDCYTPGINDTTTLRENGIAICNKHTDERGFKAVKETLMNIRERVSADGIIRLEGTCGYTIKHSLNKIELRVSKIQNNRNGTSGTLKIELWAFLKRYFYGEQKNIGYIIGTYKFDPLKKAFFYHDIVHNVDFKEPPSGYYYLTMILSEYSDNKFYTRDYRNFEDQIFLGSEIENSGKASFSFSNKKVSINLEKIKNNQKNKSGKIICRLWGCKKKHTSGSVSGKKLAEFFLDPLSPGYVYNNLSRELAYQEPESGFYFIVISIGETLNDGNLLRDTISFDKQIFLGNHVEMKGEIGYTTKGKEITLKIEKIQNNRNGSCGSLQVRLWGTLQKYQGGEISGYILGEFRLNPLNKGYYYEDIEKTVKIGNPPKGQYHVTMCLNEYNSRFSIAHYRNFDNVYTN